MTKSQYFYDAMDSRWCSNNGRSVDWNDLLDEVEIVMNNTRNIYNMITNRRQPTHAAPYNALMQVFQDTYDNEVGGRDKVTSAMVQQWFKKKGKDFKQFLAPLVQEVEDERNGANECIKRESKSRSRRSTRSAKRMTESYGKYSSEMDIINTIVEYAFELVRDDGMDIYDAICQEMDNLTIYTKDCISIVSALDYWNGWNSNPTCIEDVAIEALETIVSDCAREIENMLDDEDF